MGKKLLLISSIALLVMLASLSSGCTSGEALPRPIGLKLGIMNGIQSTLVYVAEHEGLFRKHGLDVQVRVYPLGIDALKGAMSGEVDVGSSAEFAFVGLSFTRPDLRTFAVVAELNDAVLVGRKDLGVSSAADLKGKKFGTKKGTQFHFLLGKYLELNGMTLDDVTIVTTNTPQESQESIISGSSDAVVLMEPYASDARKKLGAKAFVDQIQLGQDYYFLLECTEQFLNENAEKAIRLAESLKAAEEFTAENPAQAQKIVADASQQSLAYVKAIWPRCRFRVVFPQALISAMEDQAAWALENGLFGATGLPNYIQMVRKDILKRVSPESMTVY